jgi:hypothetical protein
MPHKAGNISWYNLQELFLACLPLKKGMDSCKKRKCNLWLEMLGDCSSFDIDLHDFEVDEVVEFINGLKENSLHTMYLYL